MEHGSTLSLEEKVTTSFHRHAKLSGGSFYTLSRPTVALPHVCTVYVRRHNELISRWWDPHGPPSPVGGLEASPLAAHSLGAKNWRCIEDLVSLW